MLFNSLFSYLWMKVYCTFLWQFLMHLLTLNFSYFAMVSKCFLSKHSSIAHRFFFFCLRNNVNDERKCYAILLHFLIFFFFMKTLILYYFFLTAESIQITKMHAFIHYRQYILITVHQFNLCICFRDFLCNFECNIVKNVWDARHLVDKTCYMFVCMCEWLQG